MNQSDEQLRGSIRLGKIFSQKLCSPAVRGPGPTVNTALLGPWATWCLVPVNRGRLQS